MDLDLSAWYSTGEVAVLLGFKSRNAVIRLIQSGHLRARRGKSHRRISGKEIARYIQASERRAAE